MITCLTFLTALTFCTLLNSLDSYLLSYTSSWRKDPALRAPCRPSCLSSSPCVSAKWLEWSSCSTALEALLQTLQWFHHALMGSSGFSFAFIFTFWLPLHTFLWAVFSPYSFKFWLQRGFFSLLDHFLSDAFHVKGETNPKTIKPKTEKLEKFRSGKKLLKMYDLLVLYMISCLLFIKC